MRILVVTRSYPSAGDLYQYPFVHRRVLAYRAAGHEVSVFRPAIGEMTTHAFEGVTCFSGGAEALQSFARDWRPEVIAAHGFSEEMWTALAPVGAHIPIRAWLHGSEIPAFFRCKAATIPDAAERAAAMVQVEARRRFWLELLDGPPRLTLVFPSRSAVVMMAQDCGENLREGEYAVIPNPIDTNLFRYRPKGVEQRFHILSVRPFDSPTYANDLSVAAIQELSKRAGFERLRFTIMGDGPLFDKTVRPLASFRNVTLRRQFLTQAEIAREHEKHGIFLVPTRLDTQGVSRDEAMASGLVPVTNSIAAVREFTDRSCAAFAEPDDPESLADELWRMIESPDLFRKRSAAAADRVRHQSGHEIVIPAELKLLADAAYV